MVNTTAKTQRGLIATLTLCLACGAGADSPASREQDAIAFLSYRSGNGDIWVVTPGDTAAPVRLTTTESFDGFPAWSPDGSRIAFDTDRSAPRNRDIWIMDADGGNAHPIVEHPAYDLLPGWSPDGRRIAFMSLRDSDWDANQPAAAPFIASIYVVDADGGGLTRLTDGQAHDQTPVWLADGSAIVFSREVDGRGQLFHMAPDGSDVRRLRTSETYDAGPAVSPDGSRLAFYAAAGGTAHLIVMALDGSTERVVTQRWPENYYAAWSPDGGRLCYTARVGDQWQLAVVDLQTGEEAQLTDDPARDEACAWRPR